MLFLYIDLTATKEGILRSRASLLTGPFLNKGNLSGKKDGTFRHFYFLAVSFSSLKRVSSSVYLSATTFLRPSATSAALILGPRSIRFEISTKHWQLNDIKRRTYCTVSVVSSSFS